jgi:hypothetical protein
MPPHLAAHHHSSSDHHHSSHPAGKVPPVSLLWYGYPDTEDNGAVRTQLGGECDNPEYVNTCAMRLSMALLNAGISLPAHHHNLFTVKAGNGAFKGKNIALRQHELSDYLVHLWGHPQVFQHQSNNAVPAAMTKMAGVVSFFDIPGFRHGHGGHIDVFYLGNVRHAGYFNSKTFWLWQAPT